MINYADFNLFKQDSLPKNLIIRYDNVTLTNSDIVLESFELNESLCSEEDIYIGACEASSVKFRILFSVESLVGKTITVSIIPYGAQSELQIGVYKIFSDKMTSDRRYKDIVAYDAMYDIINTDVLTWYNTLFPPNQTTTKTIKQIRDSFFSHFGITQESVTLINDTAVISRTIDAEKLSGKDVICAICEANGCFGHIGRDGKFKYIYLTQMIEALYPSEDLYPAEDLYPSDGVGRTLIGENGTYYKVEFEDYQTAEITKLQIRQEEDDIGVVVGSGSNGYIIEGNFLFFGMSSATLTPIAQNILTKLGLISYRPSKIEVIGNPCFEVGDGVEVVTRYVTIITYIMQRTLKGINALKDTYESTGAELRSEEVNSVNSQIMALRGSTNKLTRTIEETTSELARYETATDGTLTSYNTRITQNATSITSEATRASTAEGNLSSRITQNAEAITSKVEKGDVSSEISQEAGQVSISANRLVIDSTYFKLYANGTGKLGGLSFDSIGFYSIENGVKVFQVHPDPTDGYACSVGQNAIQRLRQRQQSGVTVFYFDEDQYGCSINHNGEIEVTTLRVKDEYVNYHRTTKGQLIVDDLIKCWGNVECGLNTVSGGVTGGSIYVYHNSAESGGQSGCVFAENNIKAQGVNGGVGDVEAAHDLVYGNTIRQSSDRRLKKEITDLKGSEELIYALKPKAFRYIRDDSKIHHGFIAQEVEEVADEELGIVYTDEEGIKSLGYIELIADLVATVQSQNERIKALEEALNAKGVH